MPDRVLHAPRSGRSLVPRARFRALAGAALFLLSAVPPSLAEVSDERAAQLERLVRQDCGSCHGMTLRGGLGPDIRAATLAGTPREALVGIILDGLPETAMPPWWPLLTAEEAGWIADYLLTENAK